MYSCLSCIVTKRKTGEEEGQHWKGKGSGRIRKRKEDVRKLGEKDRTEKKAEKLFKLPSA